MPDDEKPKPEGRLRALWRGLVKPRPVDPFVEAERKLAKADARALRVLDRAQTVVEKQEADARGAPYRARLATAAFERVVRELEAEIERLRAAPPEALRDFDVSARTHVACRWLGELESELKALAELRDAAAKEAHWCEDAAMRAVRAGEDDLARDMLARKRSADEARRALASEHDLGAMVVATLREGLEKVGLGPPEIH